MQKKTMSSQRLQGLDLARGLAMLGMLMVNFRLAMGVDAGPQDWLGRTFLALEGRSAATFVLLAGMGLVLGTRGLAPALARHQTVRRALFLGLLGLLNVLVFPADILHFYACYFVLGAWWLQGRARHWALAAALLPLLHLGLLLVLDYGRGWHWPTLSYTDFWQPAGFVRNLVFNGWHPVLPWFAFFLWGMALARLPLADARVQGRLMWGGALVFVAVLALRQGLLAWLPGWSALLGSTPLPPTPLYVASAAAFATAVVGACLTLCRSSGGLPLSPLLALGRCTLSVYIAHIVLGMGTLEELGWLQGRSLSDVALAVGLFASLAMLGAWAWLRYFRHGPLEALMRRLCDARLASARR